ncbi:SDR family NAD(P)-dependent oxidoreductase [Pseudolactococcus reticulitermitis]|uniref:Ketoreductase domain-containing protein n=1 Tax=Pseudolactococcus reticulitermitis TaxID=2025039 RepID=A0A224WZC7_9LACT|nr:glucose 1-dehydrogenase [Lactococcus reticulitermitis]GAX47428.1 hypothetical protein RsY01_1028 [Lactococcus reticulitermitis]
MSQAFQGKNVLVTGGSRGIGFAIARHFASKGARVVITATREATLAQALSQFQADGIQTVKGLILDLADLLDATAVFNQVRVLLDDEPVDILVNNAGISVAASLSEIDLTDIHRVFQVNLVAPILLAQAFAAQFTAKQDEFGSIINISSIASKFDEDRNLIYGVSKAGLNKATKNLAKSLGKQGIRVNAILPGSIDTDMTREKYRDPAVYQALVDRLPLSKRGTGDDIAHQAVFLASSEAKYITGQLISVDGGWLLQ